MYHLLAIVIMAIWGSTFISTKVLLLSGLMPVEIFVLRFALAYLGIMCYQFSRHSFQLFARNLKDELLMCLLGISGGSLYFWSENTALTYTGAGNVSFIVCTTPLMTTLLYSMLIKKMPSLRVIVAGLLALCGIALISFCGQESFQMGIIGDVLAMAASMSWAIYTLSSNDLLKQYDSAFISRKIFIYGMLTILPVLAMTGWKSELSVLLSAKVLGNILFLGLFASLLCYVFWNLVIRNLGAIKSSYYIYLNPLFTMIGSIIILGEKVTVLSVLGSIMILLGVGLAELKGHREV